MICDFQPDPFNVAKRHFPRLAQREDGAAEDCTEAACTLVEIIGDRGIGGIDCTTFFGTARNREAYP